MSFQMIKNLSLENGFNISYGLSDLIFFESLSYNKKFQFLFSESLKAHVLLIIKTQVLVTPNQIIKDKRTSNDYLNFTLSLRSSYVPSFTYIYIIIHREMIPFNSYSILHNSRNFPYQFPAWRPPKSALRAQCERLSSQMNDT